MRSVGRVLLALLAATFWFLAYVYLTLPDVRVLAHENPAATAFMDLRAREARAAGREPRRDQRWVPYARISEQLERAVLVAEDSAFWQHEGIDLAQIRESMEINLERRMLARGASTITQQLAKNLYLSPSRDPVRKLRELMLARRLEAVLSKRRILEIYLNVIEWGDGIYGAEAAARAYFRKPAAALDAGESALLAGAIINPRALNPASPSARLVARQRLILRRMGRATPPPDRTPEAAPPQALPPPWRSLPPLPPEPFPEPPDPDTDDDAPSPLDPDPAPVPPPLDGDPAPVPPPPSDPDRDPAGAARIRSVSDSTRHEAERCGRGLVSRRQGSETGSSPGAFHEEACGSTPLPARPIL
jgi:monofunctional glycosyltransferase